MVKKMQNGEEVDMQTLDYINEKVNLILAFSNL
jgi:hypothetical protein